MVVQFLELPPNVNGVLDGVLLDGVVHQHYVVPDQVSDVFCERRVRFHSQHRVILKALETFFALSRS